MNMIRAVLCVLVGIGMFIGGVVTLNSSEVMCGSEVMSPGDICEETSRGSTTERTYEEQASSNTTMAWVLMGLSPVMVIGGAVWAMSGRRRRPRPVMAYAPQYPQAGPPQPGYGGHPQQYQHPGPPQNAPYQQPPYPQGPPQGYGQQPPQGYGPYPPQQPYR